MPLLHSTRISSMLHQVQGPSQALWQRMHSMHVRPSACTGLQYGVARTMCVMHQTGSRPSSSGSPAGEGGAKEARSGTRREAVVPAPRGRGSPVPQNRKPKALEGHDILETAGAPKQQKRDSSPATRSAAAAVAEPPPPVAGKAQTGKGAAAAAVTAGKASTDKGGREKNQAATQPRAAAQRADGSNQSPPAPTRTTGNPATSTASTSFSGHKRASAKPEAGLHSSRRAMVSTSGSTLAGAKPQAGLAGSRDVMISNSGKKQTGFKAEADIQGGTHATPIPYVTETGASKEHTQGGRPATEKGAVNINLHKPHSHAVPLKGIMEWRLKDAAPLMHPKQMKSYLDEFSAALKTRGAFIPLDSMRYVAGALLNAKKHAGQALHSHVPDTRGVSLEQKQAALLAAARACDEFAEHCVYAPAMNTQDVVIWCRVLYSLAAAGTKSRSMDKLIARAVSQIPATAWSANGVRAQTLGNLLWAMAISKYTGDIESVVSGAAAAIRRGRLMQNAFCHEWSLVLWGLASVSSARTLKASHDICTAGIAAVTAHLAAGNSKPQDLSNTIWALATMQRPWEDAAPLVRAAVSGHKKYGNLSGGRLQAYSNTLWAVAAMWSCGAQVELEPSIRQLAVLCLQCAGTCEGASPQNVANIMGALASLQLTTRSLHSYAAHIMSVYKGGAHLGREQLAAVDLTCALWSCARLGFGLQGDGAQGQPSAGVMGRGSASLNGPHAAGEVVWQGDFGQRWGDYEQATSLQQEQLQVVQQLIQAVDADDATFKAYPEQSLTFMVYSIAVYASVLSYSCSSETEVVGVLAMWDQARRAMDALASRDPGTVDVKGLVQAWLGFMELVELSDELQHSSNPMHARIVQAHITWLEARQQDPEFGAFLRCASRQAIVMRDIVTVSRSQQQLQHALKYLEAEFEMEAFVPGPTLSPKLQAIMDGFPIDGDLDPSASDDGLAADEGEEGDEEEEGSDAGSGFDGAGIRKEASGDGGEQGSSAGTSKGRRTGSSRRRRGSTPSLSDNRELRTKRLQMDSSGTGASGWAAAAGMRVDFVIRSLPGKAQQTHLLQPVVVEYDGPDHFVEELVIASSGPAAGDGAQAAVRAMGAAAHQDPEDGSAQGPQHKAQGQDQVKMGGGGKDTQAAQDADTITRDQQSERLQAAAITSSTSDIDEVGEGEWSVPHAARERACCVAGAAHMSLRQLARRTRLQVRVPWWDWALIPDDEGKVAYTKRLLKHIRKCIT